MDNNSGCDDLDANKDKGPGLEIGMQVIADDLIDVVDKRYKLCRLLGAGATGRVYAAQDSLLEREVAIKVIHSQLVHDKDAVSRFMNESVKTTALAHQNIVKVYNQGLTEDGRPYIVMECLQGRSLADLIACGKRLDTQLFFDVFTQVLDALHYAHSMGLIHRDIKPSNIIVQDESFDGVASRRVVVLDFGLAKWVGDSPSQNTTQTGALLGSSAYMSPEQCRAETDLDERSDIYSLGCVMFECLVGQALFQGDSDLALMYKHLNEDRLPQLSLLQNYPALKRIIEKCTARPKEERYQSTSALKLELERCPRTIPGEKKDGRQDRRILLVASIICIALIGGAALSHFAPKKAISPHKRSESIPKPAEIAHIPREEIALSSFIDHEVESGASREWSIAVLKRWLKLYRHPHQEDLLNVDARLTRLYCELDQKAEAEKYAYRVLNSDMAAPAVTVANELAEWYIRRRTPETGVIVIDKVLGKFGGNLTAEHLCELKTMKAICVLASGDSAAAIAQLDQVSIDYMSFVNDDPIQRTRVALCRALCSVGRFAEARQLSRKCLEQVDKRGRLMEQGRIRMELADTFNEVSQVEDAVQLYSRAAKILASGKDTKESGRRADECRVKLIKLFYVQGKYERAIAVSRQVLSYCKEWQRRVDVLATISQANAALGKMDAAQTAGWEQLKICQPIFSGNKNRQLAIDQSVCGETVARVADQLIAAGHSDLADDAVRNWIQKIDQRNILLLAYLYELRARTLSNSKRQNEITSLECIERSLSL